MAGILALMAVEMSKILDWRTCGGLENKDLHLSNEYFGVAMKLMRRCCPKLDTI
jgi:hypothetical protein